jgi:dTDP-dihydrostreptose-streptidine-6-phosphate dihydrostreptosyltransferase
MRKPPEIAVPGIDEMDNLEAGALASFRRFYAQHCDQPGVFFTFCGPGLLHVLAAHARTLPRDFPVAYIFSALRPDEISWVERNITAPWLNIPLKVDDKTIWEFLFKTCRHPFGWLDVDCFLLDLSLIRELTYGERSVLSGPMIRRPLPLIRTPLVYCRPELMNLVRVKGEPVSPATYSTVPTQLGRHSDYAWSRIIEPGHVEHLSRRFAVDEWGVPRSGQRGIYDCYASGALRHTDETRSGHAFIGERSLYPLYDTLLLFQLSALAHGLELGITRTYPSNKTISGELAHFGRVGRLVDHADMSLADGVYAGSGARGAFSFFAVTLDWFCGQEDTPAAYQTLLRSVETELDRVGSSLARNRLEFISQLSALGSLQHATDRDRGAWSFLRAWLAPFS